MMRTVAVLVIGTLGLALTATPAANAAARISTGKLGVLTSGDDDWPMFQGNLSHTGVSPDTSVGASTATSLSEAWASKIGGDGRGALIASPIVVYDSALGVTVLYEVTGQADVEAVNVATGQLLWEVRLDQLAYGSPTVYDGTVYVVTLSGELTALDATTGAEQCSFTLPTFSPETVPGRIMDSPVVANIDGTGPIVFFGDAGDNTPNEHLNAGHEWAITGVGNTAGSCQEKWAFNGWDYTGTFDQVGSWSPPALAQDSTGRWLLVFGSSNPDDAVYALDAETGADVWSFVTHIGNDRDVGAGPGIAAPGVNGIADGVVYINGKNRVEYALDLITGEELWSFDLQAAAGGAAFNSVSTTAVADGDVLVTYDTYLFAINAVTGALVWQSTAMAAPTYASPSISGAPGDQVVFVGDLAGNEYGFQLSDGSLVFSASTGHPIDASTTIADGIVFVANVAGWLFAYSNPVATATTLGASANPTANGEAVTYSAEVSPIPDGGTASFSADGKVIPSCKAVPVDTTTGVATCEQSYPYAGSHTIVAGYSGDAGYQGSTSDTLTEVVELATTTALTASANPSTPSKAVTFTAKLKPDVSGGTVDFTDGGATIAACGAVAVDTKSGEATCKVSGFAAGSYAIAAIYSGDAADFGSVSGVLTEVINPASTETTLKASPNPVAAGKPVTYSAVLNPVPDGGTVDFTDGGTTITGCGAVSVNAKSHEATCKTTYGSSGSQLIVAVYSGDENYLGSTSGTLTEVVG
ncbi:MAG: Ig-like domain repeat protein [Acidimicrobiales bacterium]|jgi:outer membrane protein assembly factor BamB